MIEDVERGRPAILVYSRQPEAFAEWLRAHDCPGDVRVASSAQEALRVLDRTEVLLAWGFPRHLLTAAPRLRWVQSMGAGVDDLAQAPELPADVVLTRIVDQFGGYIAEYVFAELLARERRLGHARRLQAQRRWEHFTVGTLAGKTMGVAGLGSIGVEVVQRARAFRMRVHGLSRSGSRSPLVDRHFTPNEWPEFVRGLDVLVLTLPLTPETERAVNERVLAAMKPFAILVNVGRGRLVDEGALVAALRAGRIGGAVLDVFEREPLDGESPLWGMPNVVVTPHVSGPSTVAGVGQFFLENLQRYLRGEALIGTVDRARGY